MRICVKIIILLFSLLSINTLADKLSEQKLEFNKVIETINITENNLKLDFKIICLRGVINIFIWLVLAIIQRKCLVKIENLNNLFRLVAMDSRMNNDL